MLALCLAWAGVANAQDMCVAEDECSFLKPNVLLLLDYSSSMVGSPDAPNYYPAGQFSVTRWDAQLEAVRWLVGYDGGVFASEMRLALARFGHDPDLAAVGTTLAVDTSFPPITDGFALDIPFDDADGAYFECLGGAVEGELAVLATTPPPWLDLTGGLATTMATWTRGALQSAHALINDTRARHASEPGEADRSYHVVLMTDGEWTCADMFGQACDEAPAPEAAVLRDDGISVHVVGFGDATDLASLDEVARNGGTGEAVDARSPRELIDSVTTILDGIRDSVIVPECIAGLPRVMVVMDGSSSMLVGDRPGATNWDKARFALTGNPDAPNPGDPGYVRPIFARPVEVAGREVAIEDVVHVALMAFADADRQSLLVPFSPCASDNIAWAMDPQSSCVAPGCSDPYAGPPITFSAVDSQIGRTPPFRQPTQSFMPACTMGQDGTCRGTVPNTFTGEGLAFAVETIDAYRQDPEPFGLRPETPFINILITDGATSMGSVGTQDNLERLVQMGIDTYVIGFGTPEDLDEAQLMQFSTWGNTAQPFIVNPDGGDSATGLANAVAGIVAGLGLDPCCAVNDCALDPEPADPAPVCGDGEQEGDEACDDGNRTRGDGCDPSCRTERPLVDPADVVAPPAAQAGAPPPQPVDPPAVPPMTTVTPPPAAQPPVATESADDGGGCGCGVVGARRASHGARWLWWVGLAACVVRLRRSGRHPR